MSRSLKWKAVAREMEVKLRLIKFLNAVVRAYFVDIEICTRLDKDYRASLTIRYVQEDLNIEKYQERV